jgi:HTH-type transcriptional regulator/antitoxin HigA
MTATRGRKPANVDPIAIRNESDLDAATKEICSLMSSATLSDSNKKRIETLAEAVEAYESVHHPIPDPSQAAVLAHLLHARGATSKDLAEATGVSERTISGILSGKRTINDNQAATFASYFHVGKSVFE